MRNRKHPDLPERSHPDYGRLYREKNKEQLKAKRKAIYDADPDRYKKPYDPVASAEYRLKNQKRYREYNWRRHGIVNFDYEMFLNEIIRQEGLCKICDKVLGVPQVDHDHETGEYRGLLCKPCNFGLGVYEKNKDDFEQYLTEHGMK